MSDENNADEIMFVIEKLRKVYVSLKNLEDDVSDLETHFGVLHNRMDYLGIEQQELGTSIQQQVKLLKMIVDQNYHNTLDYVKSNQSALKQDLKTAQTKQSFKALLELFEGLFKQYHV